MSGAAVYEVRVRGHLDDHWANWLGDLTIARNDDGTSTLTAPATDQAQLHGLLSGLRDLGTPLLSLHQVDAELGAPGPALTRPVRTERLTLRPAEPEDADTTWLYRRLPAVGEWLTEIPEHLGNYQAKFAERERLASTVVVEAEGRIIGDFMLRIEDAWAQAEVADRARRTQAELGWVLDPTFTGRGFPTEAVRGLLRVCFDELGVRRVVANCFLDNEVSWRLMERVGMRREAQCKAESLHRTGRWLDTVVYALLADEWREA